MKISSVFLAALVAAGTLAAAPGSGSRQTSMVQRLTARLNLTADQQTRVQAILHDSHEQAKALQPKLREERMALRTAMKSDSEQQIDRITHQNANLNADVAAVHEKTMAKIYAMLTPEQKAKFDQRDRGFNRASQFRQSSESR